MNDDRSHLSDKAIPPRERLIFALDLPSCDEAREMVERLGDSLLFYKLGLQLFMTGGYFDLMSWLKDRGKRIMVDLKFFDVPETVRSAVAQLQKVDADFATVHGDDNILRAAVSAKGNTRILAVTVLTSLNRGDLLDMGFPAEIDVKQLVLSRAKRALAVGCDGVISSGLEARELREAYGQNFLIVMPGIRPYENVEAPPDDQKRTVDVEEAFQNGADHIVVGRPIRKAADPRAKAEAIQGRIAGLFG